jgi:hypothetical protein
VTAQRSAGPELHVEHPAPEYENVVASVLLASNTDVSCPELLVASTSSRPEAELVHATQVFEAGQAVCPSFGLYDDEVNVSPCSSAIEVSTPAEEKLKVVATPVFRTYVHDPSSSSFNVASIRGALAQKSVDPLHQAGEVPET